jgi:hypothetical protein
MEVDLGVPVVELGFPSDYDVRVLDELPGGRSLDHEFSRDGRVVDGGVLVEVITKGGEWDGLVANARESVSAAHSGIYSTPSPHVVAVVARGDAHFIDVNAPERWWVLEDSPVVAVRSAASDGLLVLATPWRVAAVGPDGVVWRTPRLAIDGIGLDEPSDGEISGVADPDDEQQGFVIDLRTGLHRGGFVFPPEG